MTPMMLGVSDDCDGDGGGGGNRDNGYDRTRMKRAEDVVNEIADDHPSHHDCMTMRTTMIGCR